MIPISLGYSCSTKDAVSEYWKRQEVHLLDWAFSPNFEGVIRLLENRLQLGELRREQLKDGRFFAKDLAHEVIFLHHDILGDPAQASSIQRKCERLTKLLDSGKPVLFLRNPSTPDELLRGAEFTQRVQAAYPKARFRIEFAPHLGLEHWHPGWEEFIKKMKKVR